MGVPFAAITAITASTFMGRLSIRCRNIAAGSCIHSLTRPLVRSGTDVGQLGVARSWCSIPKVFDGFEVRALCRPVKFFYTNLDKPFLHVPHFVHGGIVMLKQERAFLKVGSTESFRMSLYAVAFRFPFTGTKGP